MIHCMKRKTIKLVAALVLMIMMISSVSGSVLAAEYTGVTMANVLNIRTEPNTDCSIVGQYIFGTVVDIVGIEGMWYKINYNGADAYLISDYVKLLDPSEAEAYAAGRANAQRLIEIARQYIGTPYRYGGMSPAGFDCSGFTKYCAAQMGINLNRTAASQTEHGYYVSKDQLIPGDLVFFVTNGYNISHVGIYVGNGMMIHSPKPGYSVEIITIDSGYYASTYSTARRIFN